VRARDATSPARIDDQRITRAALRRRLAGLYAAIKRARTLISPFRSIVAADGAAEAVGVHLSLSLALSLSLPLLQCTYAPRSSVDASSLMPFSRNDRERGPARAIARNYCSLRGHERRASKIPFELAGELRGRKGEREEMEGEVGREVMETAAGSRGGGGRRRTTTSGGEGGREGEGKVCRRRRRGRRRGRRGRRRRRRRRRRGGKKSRTMLSREGLGSSPPASRLALSSCSCFSLFRGRPGKLHQAARRQRQRERERERGEGEGEGDDA